MAGFGVPVAGEDDPDRAVKCAISMLEELKNWNFERVSRNLPAVEIGIGLNTGRVVSGNIGSLKRMDFTMIGDGVNLAARLESACKQYAAKLLISEFTYKKLKGVYRVRDVDLVVVKGKTEPVGVYEVLDFYSDEEFPNVMEVLGHFKTGVENFRKGSWKKAIESFNNAFKIHPQDKLSQIYIKRCEHLISNPPKDWNGVWVMTSK
jgi:adenylate cyclase